MTSQSHNFSIQTISGELDVQVTIPTGFIPITDIVPVVRSLSEQAQAQAVIKADQSGQAISCQRGCAACCKGMMIPVSPPEALALTELMDRLPLDHRQRIEARCATMRDRLAEAGLLEVLLDLADSPQQRSDEDIDPINRAFYGLQLPCMFLENDACSIYEHRPAACREHLVTSPPELCLNIEKNPVKELPIPIRAGTVLALLWTELMGGPVRLIPLPVAFQWAKKYRQHLHQKWKGFEVFDKALDGLNKYLRQALASNPNPEPRPPNP